MAGYSGKKKAHRGNEAKSTRSCFTLKNRKGGAGRGASLSSVSAVHSGRKYCKKNLIYHRPGRRNLLS